MDKYNSGSDGENYKLLPPGFRFQPTDEEIVFEYLARKTFSYPLPAPVIPELLNIFTFHPWDLPPAPAGNSEQQDKYFFCNKEANNINGNGAGKLAASTTCNSGYWKATTGTSKRIISSKSMSIVGIRKTLVFYKAAGNKLDPPAGLIRTDWIMHEYYIALSENSACNKNNSQDSLVRIGNWTLCRIFLKKMISATEVDDNNMPGNIVDFMSDTNSSSASSSSPHCDTSTYIDEVSSSIAIGENTSRHI